MTKTTAVLFDWDGTLVDSAVASFRCYQEMFRTYEIDFTLEDYERTYAPAFHKTYAEMGLAPDQYPEASRLWLEAYAAQRCELIDGVAHDLERLTKASLALGIVTSGDRSRVTRELNELGVHTYFRAFVAGTDCEKKKPDPEGLLRAMKEMKVTAEESVYIGDSPEDIEMAKRGGVRSIAIPGGFPNRAALLRSGADHLVASLTEAVDLILNGAAGR